jgi:release factor glutamine methyltransferase
MSEQDLVAASYAKGRASFMGIDLLVAPGALVPRPETELLGKTAVTALAEAGIAAARVIDMCCGSANLACALAHHLPGSRVWAADLTKECVALARRNVVFRRLEDRVDVHQGDLFAALEGVGLEGTIDAVVCNPPYISEKRLETDRAQLLELEPREAFSAGPYGLSIHMRVVRDALVFLRPGGMLLFEVGLGQDRQVKILFERTRAYEDIRIVHNAAGEGRVLAARRSA